MAEPTDYTVFDTLGFGVQVMDRDWRYLYLNDVVVAQAGFTREELLGNRFPDMYPGVEETQLFAAIRTCVEEQRPTGTTNDFVFPDGSRRYFELQLHPIPEGVLIFSQDVTETTVKQLILEKHADELEDLVTERTALLSSQNRELMQLNYLVSHDLQAPLRTIRGFAELLLEDHSAELGDDGHEHLRRIANAGARLQGVVAGILRHGRIGKDAEPEEVDLGILVDDVRSDLQETLESRGGAVEIGDLPTITGLPSPLRTLFQNLIENGLKYSRFGVPPQVQVSAEDIDGTWHFAVRDNGQGIEPRFQKRVFDMFERLHRQDEVEGNGLGLAHCEKVVGLHGGRIWLESTPGEGTTFYFTLAPELPVG